MKPNTANHCRARATAILYDALGGPHDAPMPRFIVCTNAPLRRSIVPGTSKNVAGVYVDVQIKLLPSEIDSSFYADLGITSAMVAQENDTEHDTPRELTELELAEYELAADRAQIEANRCKLDELRQSLQ